MTVMDPLYVDTWLTQPVSSLDGDRPVDRIASGDAGSVLRVLARLENDTFL